MTAATLWIEITIAGSVYLAALVFFSLRFLGISNVPSIDEELLPYIAAVSVAASYILGMMMHRLSQYVAGVARKVFNRPGTGLTPAEHHRRSMIVWQFGSERLHKEVDFQFALKALFRSLLISVPLLGVTLSWWLWGTRWKDAISLVVFYSVGAILILSLIYRQQARQLEYVRNTARLISEQAAGSKPMPGVDL